jgi:hypothetical protein
MALKEVDTVAEAVTSTSCGEPESVPVLNVVDALPSAPVVAEDVLTLPSPCETPNVTGRPGMGFPLESFTWMTNGAANVVPGGPVCASPEIFWISTGVCTTMTCALVVAEPAVALICAEPEPRAVTRPVCVTVATAGSLLLQLAVSAGKGCPS